MSEPKEHDDLYSASKKDGIWMDCPMMPSYNQHLGLANSLGPNNKFFKVRMLSAREQRRRFNRLHKRKQKKK
tara:strand:- start:9 stop:224 length:216 start_codon:yes stop_codon:yes gene_type:complete